MHEQDFAEFATAHWARLVRSAVLLGAESHEAEDLAQSTLLKCLTSWSRVVGADNPTAYVATMLLNEFRRSRRRRWRGERPSSSLPEGARPSHDDAVDLSKIVLDSLAQLGLPQRQTVVLRFYLQLSEQEIAQILKVAPGTVKSRLSRSLRALAADPNLADLMGEPRR